MNDPTSSSQAIASAGPKAKASVEAPRLRKRAIGIALGMIALALGLVVWRRSSGPHTEPPAIQPDVPHAEGGAILFSKSFRERSGIKTIQVKQALLTPEIKVVGTVTFDPEHVAAVGTRIRGLVRRLAKIEGDTVKQGDLLAEIESAELGEAQAAVTMVAAQKKAAELNAARERELAERKLSTAREAEVAEASLEEYRAMLAAARQKVTALSGAGVGPFGVYLLRAPLSGTVVERHISAGQSVEGQLIAYRVADLDHLWIELAVFEKNLGSIRKDDIADVHSMANPDHALEGRVAHIGEEIDEQTRSAAVRIKVDNKERKLRPGQAVTATIRASGPARQVLLVPTRAITFVDGKPTLFVEKSEGQVVPTAVTLGASDDDETEVGSGLEEGMVIITDGVFALKSELFR